MNLQRGLYIDHTWLTVVALLGIAIVVTLCSAAARARANAKELRADRDRWRDVAASREGEAEHREHVAQVDLATGAAEVLARRLTLAVTVFAERWPDAAQAEERGIRNVISDLASYFSEATSDFDEGRFVEAAGTIKR